MKTRSESKQIHNFCEGKGLRPLDFTNIYILYIWKSSIGPPPKEVHTLKPLKDFWKSWKRTIKIDHSKVKSLFLHFFQKWRFFEFFVFQNLILRWENTKYICLKSEFPLLTFQKEAYISSFFDLLCQMLNVISFFYKVHKKL